MKFGHVSRKHEGVYRCVATDSAGKKSYNQVTINVLKKGTGIELSCDNSL